MLEYLGIWCRCKYWLTPTLLLSLRTLVSRCSVSVVDPRDSSCLLVLGLASNPELLLAPLGLMWVLGNPSAGRPRTVSWSSPLGLGQTVAWTACHNEFSGTQTTLSHQRVRASVLQRFLPREPPSSLCHGNVHSPCCTALGVASQTLQFHFLGCQ